MSESGITIAGNGDYRCSQPFKIRYQIYQLFCLAAVTKEISDIIAADHAEVAVRSLCGMEKKGRDTQ